MRMYDRFQVAKNPCPNEPVAPDWLQVLLDENYVENIFELYSLTRSDSALKFTITSLNLDQNHKDEFYQHMTDWSCYKAYRREGNLNHLQILRLFGINPNAMRMKFGHMPRV